MRRSGVEIEREIAVKLVLGAWKVLVAIKDGLVLLLMLLFFGMLFAALSAVPNPAAIKAGALVLDLDGPVVEQPEEADPTAVLTGGSAPHQYRLRDLIRALDAARTDSRVKVVVLDLDKFGGGYPATISEVAAAIRRVRDAKKPVLAYATAYTDSAYLLAANASEVWVHPIGGVMFTGPGGSRLYYKGLLDKLAVDVHVYRVGTYKSAVEPYIRADMSPAAREANQALYGSIFDQWQQAVATARPKAKFQPFLTQPDQMVLAAKGDLAKASLNAGLVDKLGDRVAFGKRVAEIAGAGNDKVAGSFATIKLANWLTAHPEPKGDIGVITIAGEIVDGKAGPGKAGGDTISKLLLDALAKKKLKALVVRVDSPGGSVLASEQIRQAILEAKAQKLPVVVSMGGLAASGGYWVSTPGDVIFAEPNTITGSIGIFGIIPTFKGTLAKVGLSADGVKTTPLTGQPDVYSGTNETVDKIIQATIEQGYARFVGLVSQSRKLSPERVDQIGQGRVWDGGTGRQLKLVDRFGTLDDAIAEAAKRAGIADGKGKPYFIEKEPSAFAKLVAQLMQDKGDDDSADAAVDPVSRMAAMRRGLFAMAVGDARRLVMGQGAMMQAKCFECVGLGPVDPSADDRAVAKLLFDQAAR